MQKSNRYIGLSDEFIKLLEDEKVIKFHKRKRILERILGWTVAFPLLLILMGVFLFTFFIYPILLVFKYENGFYLFLIYIYLFWLIIDISSGAKELRRIARITISPFVFFYKVLKSNFLTKKIIKIFLTGIEQIKSFLKSIYFGRINILYVKSQKRAIDDIINGYVKQTSQFIDDRKIIDNDVINKITQDIEYIETKLSLFHLSNEHFKELVNEFYQRRSTLDVTQIESKRKEIHNQSDKKQNKSIETPDDEIFKSKDGNYKQTNLPRSSKCKSSDLLKEHIGIVGEKIVLWYEAELVKSYYPAQLNQVQHVSQTIGDGLGYDIQSIDEYGQLKFIEVKSTTSSDSTNFFFTKNEYDTMMEKGTLYYLYRVYNINPETNGFDLKIYKGKDEILKIFNFEGQQYQAKAK